MEAFESGVTMILVLWGMLILLGYNTKRPRRTISRMQKGV
jgi:hypothetical protein